MKHGKDFLMNLEYRRINMQTGGVDFIKWINLGGKIMKRKVRKVTSLLLALLIALTL